MSNVYVVGGNTAYANWLPMTTVWKMSDADLVMFTGGTDINPELYGEKRHTLTQPSDDNRDTHEKIEFTKARDMDIPCLGICRGAQFLCAMSGGILVQHQSHPGRHFIHTSDGRHLKVTSDHHQRAYPHIEGCEHRMMAWAQRLSPVNEGAEGITLLPPDGREAEVVYYPKTRSLGIQSHPEWQFPSKDLLDAEQLSYHRALVSALINRSI